MRPVKCKCGRVFFNKVPQCVCGVKLAEPVPEVTPTWVHAILRLRKPEDTGVGDTVARLLGRFGERFKAWSKKLGIPCGCTARQAEWNRRWPY